MAFTVTINYGSGDVALTNYSGENLVYAGSLKKTTQVHSKDFRPVSGQAWFSIQPKPALMSALFALDRDQLITVSIMDGASPWFTGYVRPLTKFKDSTGKKSVDFECVDKGWLLHLKSNTDYQWEPADNMVVCNTSSTSVSLIHQILLAAGFTGTINAFNISSSIGYLRIVNRPFFEILSDLCFSYHCSFYFDAAGAFNLYDWGISSGSLTVTSTIDEADMIRSIDINRETNQPDTPIVIYHTQVDQPGVLIATYDPQILIWTAYAAGIYSNPMYWDAPYGSKGPINAATTKTFTIKHNSPPDQYDGITTTAAKITVIRAGGYDLRTGIDYLTGSGHPRESFLVPITGSIVTHALKYWISIKISGDEEKTTITCEGADGGGYRVEKIEILGSCILSQEAGRVTGPDIGPGTKEYKARYLYDETISETLATAISENLRLGEYAYSWQALGSLTIGAYYTVDNDESGVSATVRVTKKETNIDENGKVFYDYYGIRYSGFSSVVVTADSGVLTSPAIISEDSEGEIIAGPCIADSSYAAFEESGLYLMRDKMGYYDASAADWKAVINNDGTFKFDGDGSSFIEWDGSSLSIAGDLALSGSSTLAGTITAGKDIQSDNYVTDVSGWIITGNGDAEFNTVTIRSDDIQESIVSASPTDYADYQAAVPEWTRVMRLDSSGMTTDLQKTNKSANVAYTSSPTKRLSYAMTATSGNTGSEYINVKKVLLDGGGAVYGLFGWIYITATPPASTYNYIYTYGSCYLNLRLNTSRNVVCDFIDGATTFLGASSNALTTSTWGLAAIWINVDSSELTIYLDGTVTTVDITANMGLFTGEYSQGFLAEARNGISGFTDYISEAGIYYNPNGESPLALLETYRNTTSQWNEQYKPHAFNFADEISSGQLILPPGFIWGLETVSGTDTDHDVTISPGKCRDSLDRRNLFLEYPLTKQIDAAWAAGNNAGGLLPVSLLANTSYHLFLIRKDSDGSIDAGFDNTINCANTPSGYTAYRRIRSYVTDASANIIQTVQNGDEFNMTEIVVKNSSFNVTQTLFTALALGFPVKVKVRVRVLSTSGGADLQITTGSSSTGQMIRAAAVYNASEGNGFGELMTNSSGQLYQIYSGNITSPSVWVSGWTDTRGRFGGV
jgi:hypothetical protein